MVKRPLGIIVAGMLTAFGLCACDDETTSASNSPAMSVLAAGGKMDQCSKESTGEMVYVTDSAAVFYCAEGLWRAINGKNGSDGVEGAAGKNGANGQGGSSVRDTVVVNHKDTIVVRDTVVIKEVGGLASSGSSSGLVNSGGGTSLVGKPNWVYLNPAIDYSEITDERDGQVYKTVKIGGQVWMAENLNFEYKVMDKNTGKEKTFGNMCNEDDCLKFGRYYTWAVATDSAGVYSQNGKGCGYGLICTPAYPVRGVCPKGWHLPETGEWEVLYKSVNSKKGALQSVSFEANWPLASNASGFSALPAGYGNEDDYYYVGEVACFWSATEYNSSFAYHWYLHADNVNIDSYEGKRSGRSVRCVQDSK